RVRGLPPSVVERPCSTTDGGKPRTLHLPKLLFTASNCMNFIIIQPELPREEFIKLLVEKFPMLKDEILDESREDLIYSQVNCLAEYANNCLRNDQLPEFESAINFFQDTIKKADSITDNALYLDFLGCLEMHGETATHQAARALLLPEYLEFWTEFRARYFRQSSPTS
ncbi:MAG: DUF7674 family protein, partial [Janthinobacterium lividum]